MAAWAGALLLCACQPQATDPEELRQAHEKNAELRSEIQSCRELLAQWEALIQETGEDTPGLQETLDRKEAELASAISQQNHLKDQVKESKLRVIELQDRLDSFRDTFRTMQNEIANSSES